MQGLFFGLFSPLSLLNKVCTGLFFGLFSPLSLLNKVCKVCYLVCSVLSHCWTKSGRFVLWFVQSSLIVEQSLQGLFFGLFSRLSLLNKVCKVCSLICSVLSHCWTKSARFVLWYVQSSLIAEQSLQGLFFGLFSPLSLLNKVCKVCSLVCSVLSHCWTKSARFVLWFVQSSLIAEQSLQGLFFGLFSPLSLLNKVWEVCSLVCSVLSHCWTKSARFVLWFVQSSLIVEQSLQGLFFGLFSPLSLLNKVCKVCSLVCSVLSHCWTKSARFVLWFVQSSLIAEQSLQGLFFGLFSPLSLLNKVYKVCSLVCSVLSHCWTKSTRFVLWFVQSSLTAEQSLQGLFFGLFSPLSLLNKVYKVCSLVCSVLSHCWTKSARFVLWFVQSSLIAEQSLQGLFFGLFSPLSLLNKVYKVCSLVCSVLSHCWTKSTRFVLWFVQSSLTAEQSLQGLFFGLFSPLSLLNKVYKVCSLVCSVLSHCWTKSTRFVLWFVQSSLTAEQSLQGLFFGLFSPLSLLNKVCKVCSLVCSVLSHCWTKSTRFVLWFVQSSLIAEQSLQGLFFGLFSPLIAEQSLQGLFFGLFSPLIAEQSLQGLFFGLFSPLSLLNKVYKVCSLVCSVLSHCWTKSTRFVLWFVQSSLIAEQSLQGLFFGLFSPLSLLNKVYKVCSLVCSVLSHCWTKSARFVLWFVQSSLIAEQSLQGLFFGLFSPLSLLNKVYKVCSLVCSVLSLLNKVYKVCSLVCSVLSLLNKVYKVCSLVCSVLSHCWTKSTRFVLWFVQSSLIAEQSLQGLFFGLFSPLSLLNKVCKVCSLVCSVLSHCWTKSTRFVLWFVQSSLIAEQSLQGLFFGLFSPLSLLNKVCTGLFFGLFSPLSLLNKVCKVCSLVCSVLSHCWTKSARFVLWFVQFSLIAEQSLHWIVLWFVQFYI